MIYGWSMRLAKPDSQNVVSRTLTLVSTAVRDADKQTDSGAAR